MTPLQNLGLNSCCIFFGCEVLFLMEREEVSPDGANFFPQKHDYHSYSTHVSSFIVFGELFFWKSLIMSWDPSAGHVPQLTIALYSLLETDVAERVA